MEFTLLVAILLIVYMACAYRFRGGWTLGFRWDPPRALELFAVSWPMGLVTAHAFAGAPILAVVGGSTAVIALTALAHSIGHGNAMNLGRRPYDGTEDSEIWDYVAGELQVGLGFQDRWRRDATALVLSGVVVAFPVALALGLVGRPLSAVIWLIAGGGKILAYEIGWRLHREGSRWRLGTEIGEVFFGAILGLAVALTL